MKSVIEKTRSIVFRNATMISVGLFVIYIILNAPLFFTKTSLLNLCSQAACFGMITVGMMFEMVTGVSDISVGAGMYLSAAVAVRVYLATGSIPAAILAAIVVGIAGSSLTGVCVAYFGMPDMVSGMSCMFVLRGLGDLVIGKDAVINLADPAFSFYGQGKLFGLSIPVLVMIAMFCFGTWLLHCTRFGRYVYAFGDNRDALQASGVNARRIQMLCYVFTGFTVGLAGFFYAARIGGVSYGIGDGTEFNCIAACAVGGVNIAGGAGTMPGALLGVGVIAAIFQLLRLFDVNALLYKMVWGLVVILSVGLGILKRYQIQYEKIRRTAKKQDEADQTA